jgi:hypothetical protein
LKRLYVIDLIAWTIGMVLAFFAHSVIERFCFGGWGYAAVFISIAVYVLIVGVN